MVINENAIPEKSKNKKNNINKNNESERDRLIYDIVVKRYDQELQITRYLDTKAYNIIGISGIISTLMVIVFGYLFQEHYTLFFVLPICLLIFSVMFSFKACRVKNYAMIDPCALIDLYREKTLKTTLSRYTRTIAEDTIRNYTVNEKKADSIGYASILIVSAITLFFVIALFNWLM